MKGTGILASKVIKIKKRVRKAFMAVSVSFVLLTVIFFGSLSILKILYPMDYGNFVEIYARENKISVFSVRSVWKINKKNQYGKYVSLIPFSDEVTGITLTGFAYGLSDATMIKADTIGISNEIREEEGFITIKIDADPEKCGKKIYYDFFFHK